MFTYSEFSYLFESFDEKLDPIKRDYELEQMAKFSVPEESQDSVKVFYTDSMDNNGLRVIKFSNPRNEIEYHIHKADHLYDGKPAPSESNKSALSAMKLVYHDSKKEIDNNRKIFLQSLEGAELHDKFKSIANRLAAKHGKTVKDLGIMPITTAPFLHGPALIIEHATS
jgi:hypothetical protein